MESNYKLIDNEEEKQYEFHIDGFVPRVEYAKVQNYIYLNHTEVPSALKGKNIGKILVKKVLEDIEKKKLILVPLCPFVASYIKHNSEWKRLLYQGVKIE